MHSFYTRRYREMRREVLGSLAKQLASARHEARAIRRDLKELHTLLRAEEHRLGRHDPGVEGSRGDAASEGIVILQTRIGETAAILAVAEQSIQSREQHLRRVASDIRALSDEWYVLKTAESTGEDPEAVREAYRETCRRNERDRSKLERAIQDLGKLSGEALRQHNEAAAKLFAETGLPPPGHTPERDGSALILGVLTLLVLAWAVWQLRG